MIKALGRWLVVVWAVLAAALITIGREAHVVLVGGYTRGDDRHPLQRRIRIAALEHQAFPDEVHKHAPEVCALCDPTKIYDMSRAVTVPAGNWLCLGCWETGMGNSTLRGHWRDTRHRDYDVYDEWRDAHHTSCKQRMPHLYRNETPAPPREHFTWPDPLDIHPATYDSVYR